MRYFIYDPNPHEIDFIGTKIYREDSHFSYWTVSEKGTVIYYEISSEFNKIHRGRAAATKKDLERHPDISEVNQTELKNKILEFKLTI